MWLHTLPITIENNQISISYRSFNYEQYLIHYCFQNDYHKITAQFCKMNETKRYLMNLVSLKNKCIVYNMFIYIPKSKVKIILKLT